jgi:hypothetical protein
MYFFNLNIQATMVDINYYSEDCLKFIINGRHAMAVIPHNPRIVFSKVSIS